MFRDPIVEEVRRIREAQAAQFGFDPARIFADLKRRERQSGAKLVSLPPRPARKSKRTGKSQRPRS
jgi:hypothetical protein